MNEQLSDELKQGIKEGFVLVDEARRITVIGANLGRLPETAEEILLLLRKSLGLRAELTTRHGYTVI